MSECCVQGCQWHETPVGTESTLGKNKTYVTGSDTKVAILVIHDLFGWTFSNMRLLADHYAKETPATVYLPDFFDGEVLPSEILRDTSQWDKIDLPGFTGRNTKEIRKPEIMACAKALRSEHNYSRIGVIGFCYGGWAVFWLGAKAHENLVDCISTAHPSWLEKDEIAEVGVPVQVIAPEFDPVFTPELKEFCFQKIPFLGLPLDYQYFPGVEHAFAVRGDPGNELERKGMEIAKNAAVHWFRQWLHDS